MNRMQQGHTISALQLFTALFVCRLVIMLTVNAQLTCGGNFLDGALAAGISCLLNFILILPLWRLHRRRPELDILEESQLVLGKIPGAAVCLFYAVYFIAVNWYYLSFFELFIGDEMDPDTPLWLVAGAVLAAACYGAVRGLEAIMRAFGFVMALICGEMIFLLASLCPQIRSLNFEPPLYYGPKQTVMSTVLYLSRSTGFAVMALLLPLTKGKRRLGFLLWNVGIYTFMAVMLTVLTGALGDYLKIQLFPVYTAASAAGYGPFRRLDALFLSMWMMGLFLKLSLDLYLAGICMKKAWGEEFGRPSVFVGALLIAAVSLATANSEKLQAVFFGPWFLLSLTALAAVAIPAILLVLDRRREKR